MGAPVDSLESRNPGIEFAQQAAAIASTAIHLAGASSMPLKPRNIIKQVVVAGRRQIGGREREALRLSSTFYFSTRRSFCERTCVCL
jgi:hypothetical protein